MNDTAPRRPIKILVFCDCGEYLSSGVEFHQDPHEGSKLKLTVGPCRKCTEANDIGRLRKMLDEVEHGKPPQW